jgi:hypothetical protein
VLWPLGRAPLRDRAPESDFRGYFSDTETKLDEGNTAISRHFERGPLWYALETDWLAGAAGFELLHSRIGMRDSNFRIWESDPLRSLSRKR